MKYFFIILAILTCQRSNAQNYDTEVNRVRGYIAIFKGLTDQTVHPPFAVICIPETGSCHISKPFYTEDGLLQDCAIPDAPSYLNQQHNANPNKEIYFIACTAPPVDVLGRAAEVEKASLLIRNYQWKADAAACQSAGADVSLPTGLKSLVNTIKSEFFGTAITVNFESGSGGRLLARKEGNTVVISSDCVKWLFLLSVNQSEYIKQMNDPGFGTLLSQRTAADLRDNNDTFIKPFSNMIKAILKAAASGSLGNETYVSLKNEFPVFVNYVSAATARQEKPSGIFQANDFGALINN